MRNLAILLFVMQSCMQQSTNRDEDFSIKISELNYSLAYTTQYIINQDSVIVLIKSGVEGEKNKILIDRPIEPKESQKLRVFLSTFPINRLSNQYKDSLIEDGDQKRVEVVWHNKNKTIDLENYYQEDMSRLFKAVNSLLAKEIQIKYSK